MNFKPKWMLTGLAALGLFAGPVLADDLAKAKEMYDKDCKKCHAEDGSGKKDGEWLKVAKTLKLEKPESLSLISEEAKKASDADMQKAIIDGGKKMKGFKDKISEAEAKQLVAFVRQLQGKK